MGHDWLYHDLLLLGLLWLSMLLYWAWLRGRSATSPTFPLPAKPIKKRTPQPKPFAGLLHKPLCDACEHAAESRPQAPCVPPPRLTFTRGRQRTVETQQQFCPDEACSYYGRRGRGNIRANGHPGGKPWRQFQCVSCHGYFQETYGIPMHSKRVSPEMLIWAVGALAEGLGIRAVARAFEVDPNTVLAWLMAVADHAAAFSRYFLHDVGVTPVQLDELFAVLSAVKTGEVSATEAIHRLERSPHWVWMAMDPQSKLLLTIDVGDRTLAMAQCVVHHVTQVVAPDCAPLFLTDGFREYMTALLTHYGHWVQPPRRQAKGPAPKPRWMPRPRLLYAQVVKSYRRRHLVAVKPRVVFGTMEGIKQVLAAGRSIPRLWSASTWPSVSMWRRWDVGSPRCVRARTVYASSWRCSRSTTTSCYRMPAYISRCRNLSPPMARAPPNSGDPAHRR